MYLIVGLGNPGDKYKYTRHNIGFRVIEKIADSLNINFNKKKNKSIYGKGKIDNIDVVLLKPLTFMNLSGEAVLNVASYFKIPSENIIIIYDDLDIEFRKIKIKKNGSAGGHNGIKSIITHLNTTSFPRMKIGIGRNPENISAETYVLSRFLEEEEKELNSIIERAKDGIMTSIKFSIERGMNDFNS